jgi:hypothetical protein
VADVDIDMLDAALHAARARLAVREVVAAVRRVNGLEPGPVTRRDVYDHSSLRASKSVWIGIKEGLAAGFLVGSRAEGEAWRLAIHPRYQRRK